MYSCNGTIQNNICHYISALLKDAYNMPITINGKKYYWTKEACQITGISRSTLVRWVANGIIRDSAYKDRRGWRLFTEADIKTIKDEAKKIL